MENIHRFPLNIEGDFYTSGTQDINGEWCCDCLDCGLPECEAPSLLAQPDNNNHDTYFIKQPETEEELRQAISAVNVCCVDAVRYGGKNKNIISLIPQNKRDFKINIFGKVVRNKKHWRSILK